MPAQMQQILDAINTDLRDDADRGEVASYIPELGQVDPRQFAITVATADGQIYSAGTRPPGFQRKASPRSLPSPSRLAGLATSCGAASDESRLARRSIPSCSWNTNAADPAIRL